VEDLKRDEQAKNMGNDSTEPIATAAASEQKQVPPTNGSALVEEAGCALDEEAMLTGIRRRIMDWMIVNNNVGAMTQLLGFDVFLREKGVAVQPEAMHGMERLLASKVALLWSPTAQTAAILQRG